MAVRKQRQKDGAVYFAAFTCQQWVPLLQALNGYDIVNNWMQLAQPYDHGNRRFRSAIRTPVQ